MTQKMTKAQLILELEQAQKRITELELVPAKQTPAKKAKASIRSKSDGQDWQEKEAFYQAFVEQSYDGIVILDEQGNVNTWNSAQENIMGLPREEAIGKKYWDVQFSLLSPELRDKLSPEKIKDALQNTFKTGEYYSLRKLREAEILSADGKKKFIQVSPFSVRTKTGYRLGLITRDITNQKKALDTILENEERLSLIFHTSPSPMGITDSSSGQYVDVNEAFLQSLGFTQEEVIGKTASELNLFFDPNQRAALLAKMSTQGYLREEDVLVQTKTGGLRHGVFSGKYIQLHDQKFLLTVMNDITERKQAEEKLRSSEERHRNLIENINEAVVEVDEQGRLCYISPSYFYLSGYTPEEEVGSSILAHVHPDDLPALLQGLETFTGSTLQAMTYRIRAKNGEWRWVETSGKPYRLVNGEQRVIGVMRDITDRKLVEEKLQQSETRLKGFLDAAPDAMIIADSTGRIILANLQTEILFGYTQEELSKMVVEQLVPAHSREIHPKHRANFASHPIHITEGVSREIQALRKDRSEFSAEISLSLHNMGEDMVILSAIRDITERKKAEAALQKNQMALLETQTIAKLQNWTTDFKARSIEIGPGYDKILGWPAGIYPLEAVENIVHPLDVNFVTKAWEQAAQNNPLDIEYRILINGELKWLHVMTYEDVNNDGKLRGFTQDITKRKQAEVIAYSQRNLARLVSAVTTDEEALPNCLETALEISGMDSGGIYLFDQEKSVLNLTYHKGLGETFIQSVSRYLASAPNAQAVLAGMMFYFNEPEMTTQKLYKDEGLRSLAVIPVLDHGHVLGCINIASHSLPYVPEISRQAIETIAAEIGNVISHLRTEMLLQETRERLVDAQELAHIGNWEWNLSEQTLIWSDEVYRIFGVTPTEFTPTVEAFESSIHPEDREEFLSRRTKMLEEKQVASIDHRIILPDGSIRHVQERTQIILDANGNMVRVIGTVQDITERKLAEESIRKNTQILNESQAIANLGSWTADLRTGIFDATPEGARLVGWTPGLHSSGELMEIIHPDDREFMQSSWQAAMHGAPYDIEHRILLNGEVRWLHIIAKVTFDNNGAPLSALGVTQDITDRKKAEAAIHQIEKRNTVLIENAPDGIALIDMDGIFVFASPSAYRMFGYTKDEIVGTHSRDKVHPQDIHLIDSLRDKLLDTPEESQTLEYRFLHMDGSYHWLESTYTNMFDEPSVLGIVVNFRDITDRKLAEETNRQQSERLRLLYEASQQLNRTLDVQEIYQTICDFMMIIAPSDTLFISEFDSETQLITCKAYWIQDKWMDVSVFPSIPLEEEGKGTQSMVIRSGEALLSNDYQKLIKSTENIYYVEGDTNEITDDDPPEDEITRSALIVPLKSGGQVKGVIQVASYQLNAYTENQLKLLEALALHITSAEQNAILYSQLRNELNERKQTEDALRNSEEKYRVLVKSLDTVIASVDRDGRFLYMNDMAAEQIGASSTESLIGKTMYELFPERVASQQMMHVQQVLDEDKGNTFESLSAVNGKPRWYRTSIQPIHSKDGSASQVLINSTDIHDLKTTQQELQELNRTLEERVKQRTEEVQDLYDNAPAGYHSLDVNGNVILINQTELNWLGYSREEVVGQPLSNFYTTASAAKFKENFPEFKRNGWLRDTEFDFIRKDGTVFPILVNAVAVYDENKNYVMSRSTVLDNTEHKAVDEALRNANLEMARAMRMKDEFLASMSHELRTPLNGILGLSEALQEDVYGPLSEKQKATIIHIENSGRHLLDLISDILDVSKIEAGKFELEMLPCSLGDICQSSIYLTKGMAAKKRQNVSFNMSPASITVNGDGRRLKQVLVNLLSNAVKFTPEEGSLGLEVVENSIDNIVYISVWDKGIGISTEDIKKLFQPFVQLDSSLSRQQTGTGLGLALVQRLVEMHGGSIEVQSTPGQGSRFTVALSCLPSDAAKNTDKVNFKSKFHYALIIEDESMDAGHLARYCKALGITPIVHNTGQDAFERVIATRPNIVFLDLHLPDLSGWAVLEQLKASPETKHIPVVITSVEDDKPKASELKADGYLVKFFTVSDMRNVLSTIQKTSASNDSPSARTSEPIATIMIVDDNEVNIETVFDYLGAKNFNVISAKSGVEFLTTAPLLHPDLILMDIQMPEMDGLETIRRLRAHKDHGFASVPVIALTALAMPGDRENCIEAGADEYITKPFRLSEITELITQMLEDKKRKL